VKILLVDDHPLFRDGIRAALSTLDPALQIDEADSVADAKERLVDGAYGLILLDLNLPDFSGLQTLGAMLEAGSSPIVVVSGDDSPDLVRAAIEAGAVGFVPKSFKPAIVIAALRLILAGGVYLPPAALVNSGAGRADPPIMNGLANGKAGNPLAQLTARQAEVVPGVIAGKPYKSIARELGITEHTVKAHAGAVFRALGVHNRTEVVYAAARLGLKFT